MDEYLIHPEQHLLRFRAPDGFWVTSHLLTKDFEQSKNNLDTPLVLHIHGLLGHFLARGTPRLLPHALLEHGVWSMSINTRLAFAGQLTGKGIFNDTLHEIDAAVAFLTQKGFQQIFLLGYSLGASMVVHWAANRIDPNVKGFILEGLHYSLPDSQRRRLAKWGSTPTYEEISERAKAVLGDDPYHSLNDETFVIYRSRGATSEPINDEIFTYKSWWHMMGPEAYAAMAHRHIGTIKKPILIIRGENDPLIEEWEPEALAQIVRASGNRNIWVRQIPQAGHDCMENPVEMLKGITGMVSHPPEG